MINWHGASGAVRACERYGPFVPFPQNITTAGLAAFRGARRSRMDRANPSFATLFPAFHDPFPLQAARPADKYITRRAVA